MSYRLENEESVIAGVRRVANEQIEQALEEIDDPDLGRHETVHQVRKRCKKIRALVRLVRPQFEETYQFENAWYRDAADELSYLRDAQSVNEIYDQIIDRYQDEIDLQAFEPIARYLRDRRQRITKDEGDINERLETFRARLVEGQTRIDSWSIGAQGWEAVAGGLAKTYKRGRNRFADAYTDPGVAIFHEWRKRVKYHWYHSRLLRNIWVKLLDAYREEVHLLADYLGDMHDLAILRETLTEERDEVGQQDSLEVLFALIDRRIELLRAAARPLGQRLYYEKPPDLVQRWECYWDAWRS